MLRRLTKPLVHKYITVSTDLENWLIQTVGICHDRVKRVYNGVDLQRFSPRVGSRPPIGPNGFAIQGTLVIGTVGRLEKVKDQLTLVRAFIHLLETESDARKYLRLVIIGDGTFRKEAMQLVRAANVEHLAYLPGEQSNIPEILQSLDLFVLPSLREGISNTILEAMASGLPVVATRVGGNPELVDEGKTGLLVPPSDPKAMAESIRTYLVNPDQLTRHGQAGRKRAEAQFSMEKMVNGYLEVYDSVLNN